MACTTLMVPCPDEFQQFACGSTFVYSTRSVIHVSLSITPSSRPAIAEIGLNVEPGAKSLLGCTVI